MIQHVFPKGFKRIGYYGVQATKTFEKVKGLIQEALAKVKGVVKGAIKIIPASTYRQRDEQSLGRDPLVCKHCQHEMGVTLLVNSPCSKFHTLGASFIQGISWFLASFDEHLQAQFSARFGINQQSHDVLYTRDSLSRLDFPGYATTRHVVPLVSRFKPRYNRTSLHITYRRPTPEPLLQRTGSVVIVCAARLARVDYQIPKSTW